MCHVLKSDYDAIKQFLDSMEADPGKRFNIAFKNTAILTNKSKKCKLLIVNT